MNILHTTLPIKHTFMFSYLRYAILGQIILYTFILKSRARCWKIWQKEIREEWKKTLSIVGQSIFTPYAMGPHQNDTRILLPGDSKILSAYIEQNTITYHMECPWKSWHTNFKSWPWVYSQQHTAIWKVPMGLDGHYIEQDHHGFHTSVIEDIDFQVSQTEVSNT